MKRLLLTFSAAVLCGAQAAHAEELLRPTKVRIAHGRAIESLVHASGMGWVMQETAAAWVDRSVQEGVITPAEAARYKTQLDAPTVAYRMAPYFAQEISEQQAKALTSCLMSRGGQLVVQDYVLVARERLHGRTPPANKWGPAEWQLIAQGCKGEPQETWQTFTRYRFYEPLWLLFKETVPAYRIMESFRESFRTFLEGGEFLVPERPLDESSLSRVIWRLQQQMGQVVVREKDLVQAFKALGAAAPIAGRNLVRREQIQNSRQVIEATRRALNDYLAAQDAYPEQLRATVTGEDVQPAIRDALLKGLDLGSERLYDWQTRFGANQRAMLALFERILTLAESEYGRIALEGDNLLFEREEALRQYRDLMRQAMEQGEIEGALLAERRTWAKDSLEKMGRAVAP